ncbi:hypothetical protein EON64_09530 [archaeon]|nr:MAG: hypothetical protein EON64_09530 [archaeon]
MANLDDVLQDVNALIAEKFTPSIEVLMHKTSAGKLCSCCKAARATFRSSIIAAAGRSADGVYGVLMHLSRFFSWGITFPHFLCEILQAPRDLDCGAMTALAIYALQLYADHVRCRGIPELTAVVDDLVLCNVQLIFRDDPSNVSLLLRDIQSKFGPSVTGFSRWLKGNCMYHQCLGLFRRSSKQLLVWDYGKFEIPNSSIVKIDSSILGVAAVKVNTVGVYMTGVMHWHNQQFLMANDWNILYGTDSVSLKNLSASTTQSSSPLSSLVGSPVFPLGLRPTRLKVFISACHMSGNPNPGLGLARCVRVWFDSLARKQLTAAFSLGSLHLVGMDDVTQDMWVGLNDPVFDEVRDMMSYGAIYWSEPYPLHELARLDKLSNNHAEFWLSVVQMLSSSGEESFFLPVRSLLSFFHQPYLAYISACLNGVSIRVWIVRCTSLPP